MKRAKPFYDVHVDENDVAGSVKRLSDSIRRAFEGLTKSPIVSGSLITDIDLSTTAIRVEHKLGRKPLGYIVVRQNANAVVYEQDEERQDLFLNLRSSATVRVSLWIF